eukprot:2402928-Rhodomonas_salina.2
MSREAVDAITIKISLCNVSLHYKSQRIPHNRPREPPGPESLRLAPETPAPPVLTERRQLETVEA